MGPGYFTITQPLGIRNDLLYILIVSDSKYPGPIKLNMQTRDLWSNFILRITSFRYFDLSLAFCQNPPCIFIKQLAESHLLYTFLASLAKIHIFQKHYVFNCLLESNPPPPTHRPSPFIESILVNKKKLYECPIMHVCAGRGASV